MHKYRITEILCVTFAVLFVFFTNKTEKPVEMSSEEIFEYLNYDSSGLLRRDRRFIKEQLSFDAREELDFIYYSSDDVMNVNEIFIAVTGDGNTKDIISAIETYVAEKFNLFNGYAPEQAALLDGAVIETVSDLVFFCVGTDAKELFSALSSVI